MTAFPDPSINKMVQRYGPRIDDSVERLRFVLFCSRLGSESVPSRRRGSSVSSSERVLDFLAGAPGPTQAALGGREKLHLWWLRQGAHLPGQARSLAVVSLLLLVSASLTGSRHPSLEPSAFSQGSTPEQLSILESEEAPEPHPQGRPVWLVETAGSQDFYSNGLRVSNEFVGHTGPRSFPVFARGPGADEEAVEWRARPVGIVYHTTLSDYLAPLKRDNNDLIRYQGRNLLRFIQKGQFYHFVVDRFGRVFRIVPETEYAHHAGHSIWAEGAELYVNLNQSFIGVAFETRPEAVGPGVGAEEAVTPAQLASGRLLTDALRDKFGILAANCVTHEMVSVNPANMRIGHHTDWRGRFPFGALGLPDNYRQSMPSLAEWGFTYDSQFVREIGGRVWPGVRRSQKEFRTEAAVRELPVVRYRWLQQRRFRQMLARIKDMAPAQTWLEYEPTQVGAAAGPARSPSSEE